MEFFAIPHRDLLDAFHHLALDEERAHLEVICLVAHLVMPIVATTRSDVDARRSLVASSLDLTNRLLEAVNPELALNFGAGEQNVLPLHRL